VSDDIGGFVNLLEDGADRAQLEAAAARLPTGGAALTGAPPPRLIAVLTEDNTTLDEPLLHLVRAWSRPEMSRALLDALIAAPAVDTRRQAGWLLKSVLAVEHRGEAIDRVLDSDEDAEVRRWLIEALERFVFGDALGWDELDPVVTVLTGERAGELRAGLALLLSTLPWRASNTALLEPLLLDDCHEVVSAAAYTLARHPEAVATLPPETLDRLRVHTNAMMRRCAAVLEASLRSKP
jgi:hypothetical protein